MGNETMSAYWDESGRAWVRLQDTFARMLDPFHAAVIETLDPRPGERVLDVGCGFGPTLALVAAAGAHACGVDLSSAMVEAARRRVPRARVELADAQTGDLATIFGARFDAVTSAFGVMFFDDPVAAFANIAAACQPDARLAFVCWRAMEENPVFTVGSNLLMAALPEPLPPPTGPGPFAFADADHVRALLAGGGWTNLAVERFDAPCRFASVTSDGVEERIEALLANQVGRAFQTQVPADEQAAVLDAVRVELRALKTDGELTLPGAAWIVNARRS